MAEQVWHAAGFNDTPTLRVLLNAGVAPNYIAPQGSTALITSVKYGKLAQVQMLLKAGATVDDHHYKGQTIFDIAHANSANGWGGYPGNCPAHWGRTSHGQHLAEVQRGASVGRCLEIDEGGETMNWERFLAMNLYGQLAALLVAR